jgi:Uncharacterized protein conserved in bacteria (DUF2330)
MRFPVVSLALAMAASSVLALPRSANACGGTFCDTGPRAMPVDQTGENILFVMQQGTVEAHIQIQYRGDAARFSWVLPVQALPDFEVGSQALFSRLLAATVPRYGYTTQRDFCGPTTGSSSGAGGSGGSGGGFGVDASVADSGVTVVLQKTVGAFEVKVLSGGTADEVLSWLATNGYQVPTNAPALFQDYVAKSYLFVAVKLTGGAGIDEIHPLVVRYQGTQPCVPLKLTAVAAVEDMGVRTFFLGTKRVVPKNYKHVVLNPAKLDWIAFGANYKELVGRAADSPVANGKAFTTEYAGPTAIVGNAPIAQASWNPDVFTSLPAVDVVTRLQQQGLMTCYTGFVRFDGGGGSLGPICNYFHPLLQPLLRTYLPAPATLNVDGGTVTDPNAVEGYFYSCLSCYSSSIDQAKWNGAAFAGDLRTRIVEPARHADALLATWPYLTRMFTTISPAEMTEDPEFHAKDGLPPVSLPATGVRRIACNGQSGMSLPDGRQVALTPLGTWPLFDMPWAERIEEYPATGNPIVLVDNTQRINAQLALWNEAQGWPPQGTAGAGTGSGGTSGPGGATGAGGYGSSSGGAGGRFDGGTGYPIDSSPGEGCSCSIPSAGGSSALPLGLATLLGLARALRRRART